MGEMGRTPRQAAFAGMQEIGFAVVATTVVAASRSPYPMAPLALLTRGYRHVEVDTEGSPLRLDIADYSTPRSGLGASQPGRRK